jgi:anoctamin-4
MKPNYLYICYSIYFNYIGTIFFELWRRKQEILKWEWDLQDEEDMDEARPEFERDIRTTR